MTTATMHAVSFNGKWRWILSPADYAAYKQGKCPFLLAGVSVRRSPASWRPRPPDLGQAGYLLPRDEPGRAVQRPARALAPQRRGQKTLGAMNDVFAEKAFAVTIMLLMFLPALPLPTGGVTHVFEVITVLLAAQMVLGRRTIWLPERLRRRELGGDDRRSKAIPFIVRRIRQVERFSRPRAAWLFAAALVRAASSA